MSENEEKTPDITALHHDLINQLIINQSLKMDHVEAAFRAVPRHLFLPKVPLEQVYSDQAIPTKFQDGKSISSSSQPAIMAIMLEQLDLQPGHRVLEIGAGTGYNAALLAYLVGDSGSVTTIDLDEDTAAGARSHLAAAGFEQVKVVCADGMKGYAPDAPYDRIILTVGGWDIAPQWLEQLQDDGRILLPLSINGPQLSVAFDRQDGHLVSVSVRPCGFMRVRGELAEPQSTLSLGPDPGLFLDTNDMPEMAEPDVIFQWLTGPHQDWSTGVEATPRDIFSSLTLWLSLNEPRLCSLGAKDDAADKGLVPPLLHGKSRWVLTFAILAEDGLSTLMRAPDFPPPPDDGSDDPPPPFTLFVRSFGPNNDLARQLIDQVRAWDLANRPGVAGLRIRAYPVANELTLTADEQIIRKRWHQFVIDYPDNQSK